MIVGPRIFKQTNESAAATHAIWEALWATFAISVVMIISKMMKQLLESWVYKVRGRGKHFFFLLNFVKDLGHGINSSSYQENLLVKLEKRVQDFGLHEERARSKTDFRSQSLKLIRERTDTTSHSMEETCSELAATVT